MNINPEIIDLVKYILVVTFAVGIFLLYPFAVIWAINAIFGLSVKYTIWSWLGIIILHIFFQGNAIISIKRKK